MTDIDDLEIAEIEQLHPLVASEDLDALLNQVDPVRRRHSLDTVRFMLDLEHLQVADYAGFYPDTPGLVDALSAIRDSGWYDPREITFLALRSLVSIHWERPTDSDHLRSMLEVEMALQEAMAVLAGARATVLSRSGMFMPYWGRLAHLDLLRQLPTSSLRSFHPERIPCVLVRTNDINANTVAIPGGHAIALNYALDPFLKDMNRFLVSYVDSRDMAGVLRIPRAFRELIPRALHLRGLIPPHVLPPFSILFGKGGPAAAKAETDRQIRFILAHELGHVALGHPGVCESSDKRSSVRPPLTGIPHDQLYEFEADAFALEWMRSRVMHQMRYHLNPKRNSDSEAVESLRSALEDYGAFVLAVNMLFCIMDFMQSLYAMLATCCDLPPWVSLDSHPAPIERRERLSIRCAFEEPMRSDYADYSRELLSDILSYGQSLNPDEIRTEVGRFL